MTSPSAGNVVAGNTADGIITAAGTAYYNRIGVSPTSKPLGNGGNGIYVHGPMQIGSLDSWSLETAPNIIAYNGKASIATNTRYFVLVRGNSIHDNATLGFDSLNNGVSTDNIPAITSISTSAGQTTVNAALNTIRGATVIVDIFSSDKPDPSGYGEGADFLASLKASASSSGTASIQFVFSADTIAGKYVTLTSSLVILPSPQLAPNTTSEFSQAVFVPATLQITSSQFQFNSPTPQIKLTFNHDLQPQSLQPADLTFTLLPSTQSAPPSSTPATAVTYDAPTRTATFTLANTPLADGNYRINIPTAALSDSEGVPLDIPLSATFYSLAADANRDRTVDFNDLVILAQNYNSPSPKNFSQGDFNHDGTVDFNDLVLLAQHYNTQLQPPTPAAPTLSTPFAVPAASPAASKKLPVPTRPRSAPRPVAKPMPPTKFSSRFSRTRLSPLPR